MAETRAPSFVETEPATFWGAINFALISTWAVVDQAVPAIPDGVSTALGIAIGSWVLVASFIVRSKVTPVLPEPPEPPPA